MIRQRAGFWFAAGVLTTVVVAQLGPTSAAIEDRSLLVESSCALDVMIHRVDAAPDRVSLRSAGTYRLGAAGPGLVLEVGPHQRAVRELPLTAGGAVSLPPEWCAGGAAPPGGPGLGL